MNYPAQWGASLSHLLHHDDRIDALGGVVAAFAWLACGASFADVLGVDPQMMATRASADRMADAKHRIDEEWERLFGPDDGDDDYGLPRVGKSDRRASGLRPTSR